MFEDCNKKYLNDVLDILHSEFRDAMTFEIKDYKLMVSPKDGDYCFVIHMDVILWFRCCVYIWIEDKLNMCIRHCRLSECANGYVFMYNIIIDMTNIITFMKDNINLSRIQSTGDVKSTNEYINSVITNFRINSTVESTDYLIPVSSSELYLNPAPVPTEDIAFINDFDSAAPIDTNIDQTKFNKMFKEKYFDRKQTFGVIVSDRMTWAPTR